MSIVHEDIEFYKTDPDTHQDTPEQPQPPADDAPLVEWATYYARLGLKVVPVHTPLFDKAGTCTGCTCEDYKRSEKYRKWLTEHGRGREFDPAYKCQTPGKHPRFAKWQERATHDEAEIRKWWRWWPDANVGHNPGRAEFGPQRRPLIMLDGDTYKDNYAGAELALPTDTPTALTGNLGEHDYFYMPPGKAYGQHTGDMPAGVDIRGVDGLDILHPSLHYSGRRYQWEADLSLNDVEPQELPQHVIDLIESHDGRKGAEIGPSDIEAVGRSSELVENLLQHAELDNSGAQAWGDGRRWIMHDCPYSPTDDPHAADGGSFIVVYQDGTIGSGCHHNRCQHAIKENGGSGWQYLKKLAGFQAETDITFEDDQQRAYVRWLASPDALDELREAGFKNVEKARKLLDTICQDCQQRGKLRIKPGYAYLCKGSTISQGGMSAYLARLYTGGFINLHPGEKGDTLAIELVLHNLNAMSLSPDIGVQVVQNWKLYREFRSDEVFINNHAVYNATRTQATLPALGDNGLGVLLALQDGPVTTKEAAAEVGYTYGAMARTLRRYAEHGLAEVTVGYRGLKSYTLNQEWRSILQANRPKMPTYAVLLNRHVNALESRSKYLHSEGKVEKAQKAEDEHKRLKVILDKVKEAAGIVPYQVVRVTKEQQRRRRLTQAYVIGERAEHRPSVAVTKPTDANKWRRKEYAQVRGVAEHEWEEFNAWATVEYGSGWWAKLDQTDVLGRYQAYEFARDRVPTMQWVGNQPPMRQDLFGVAA